MLDREASRCQREGQPASILIADIDRFKAVNDTYGHLVGDQVIKQVTQKMGSVLRPYDSVGRFGGEEFLVIVPNCGLNEAKAVAERVRASVAVNKFMVGTYAIPVSVSVGVSTIAKAGHDTNWALQAADCALYKAKKNGRNRVECCMPGEETPPSSPPREQGHCREKDGSVPHSEEINADQAPRSPGTKVR